MEPADTPKPLVWVGSSKRDLMRFPDEVIHAMGVSLLRAQYGDTPPSVKPLRGFGSAGVLEIIEDEDGNTYRAVYTVRFRGRVNVRHAFQKKSKHGIATPKHDLDLIRTRLNWAAELHQQWERQHAKDTNIQGH